MEAEALEALVFDPSRCSKLSMDQKRELVYEMSKWPEGASEMLQAWSRQEILQILCAELGKERKYTGLTKSKIIENLLKIVDEKKAREPENSENDERTVKRQRKPNHPNHFLVGATDVGSGKNTVYCKNSACKAKLNHDDVFCKRCSCCICRQYDDNKDPSLWLICNSDPPFRGASCNMSCHLECALRIETSGISQDRLLDKGIDGSFCCVSCGKVNDLLSSWRKQLLVARDTRRVDILCYRLSLSQKILAGTKHYQNLYAIIDEAVKKLEEDVGPLTGLPVKKARGIVNRLSSGPEIQRLCASALESLDLMLANRVSNVPSGASLLPPCVSSDTFNTVGCNTLDSKLVRLEDIRATSLLVIMNPCDSNVVGCSLWHRKADDLNYPTEPTHRLLKPNTKFLLCDLTATTKYFLKVISLDTDRETDLCEFQFQTGSSRHDGPNFTSKIMELERSESPAPSSIEDETNNVYVPSIQNADNTATKNQNQKEDVNVISLLDEDTLSNPKESSDGQTVKETSTDNQTRLECVPYSEAGLPITPCKFENTKDENARSKDTENGSEKDEDEPQAGSSSKKRRSRERSDDKCSGIGDKDFEYYVKVIRWLECDGHIETSFREKFLTWYGLRATPQEVRIVKVFIDTFIEDPESLSGQLIDSFSDVISNKRCSRVPPGFCMKLWH